MPINDILSSITGAPSPSSPSATSFPPKRKATIDLPRPMDKLQRTNSLGVASNSSRPPIAPSKPSAPTSTMAAMKIATKSAGRDAPATIKNGHPTPPPTSDAGATKAPKKGSFAEIMARGKMAQQTIGQIGKIQHKKIEKAPSRREREEMNNQKVANIQKNLGPNGKFKSAMPTTSSGKPAEKVMFRGKPVPVPEKKIKKAAVATTGYTGTARPRPDGAKPALKSGSLARGPDRYRDQRRPQANRYVSEEEDEEDIEEEDGYGSDASSDMEAAGWEVDDEEEQAARIARKEDAEALAEENRLKREKLEKKRRLEALAKKRR